MNHVRTKRLFLLFLCLLISSVCLYVFSALSLAAKQGGVLKVAIGVFPGKIDPPNTQNFGDYIPACHIFEQLLQFYYDEKEKKSLPKPLLAEKWTRSDNGKVWTFYLKRGVKFHDGTPFNAAAVKFNIERLVGDNPPTLFGNLLRPVFDHAKLVDDYTIEVHLVKPVAIFLNLIGMFSGTIRALLR